MLARLFRVSGLSRVFSVLLISGFCCTALCGQSSPASDPLAPEVESVRETVDRLRLDWMRRAVDSAVGFGLVSVADDLLEQVFEEDPASRTDAPLLNRQLQVSLVLGDLEQAAAAREALMEADLPVDPLLQAYYHYLNGDPTQANTVLTGIPLSSLSQDSLSWFYLLRALLLSGNGDPVAANESFQLAESTAATSFLRNHFEILRLKEDLRGGVVTADSISALRESVRSMQGDRGGFEAARLLAIALNQSGETAEAIDLLAAQLAAPGLREFGLRPDFLLLLAMIAGTDSERGKLSLRQIVSEGEGDSVLSLALSLLAREAVDASSRQTFLDNLGTWLEMDPPHPLMDRLLAYHAHFLVSRDAFPEAEASAQRLVTEFPASEFVPAGLRLLAYISWNQNPPRFRTAAEYLSRLRQLLPEGPAALEAGILIADCFFLNGDFTSASDAYGAVFNQAGTETASRVFFQRILSEIAAGRPGVAATLLDAAYPDPRIDPAILWKAEWNLLDDFRNRQEIDSALQRLGTLIDPERVTGPIPADLNLRMEWLSARLNLEADRPQVAIDKALTLQAGLQGERFSSLDEELRSEVESHLLLLIGEAHYKLNEPVEGLETFTSLRERFPESGPVILSYLVESRFEAGQDNLVSAQQSLIDLVDRFPESEFAPIALWEAALSAEQRGLAVNLQESITILERLVTDYPDHPLIYYARLKQGDLARRLNDFPTALLLYDRLLTTFPEHPERYRTEMNRADCLMALASEDRTRYDLAAAVYERTCLLPGAPLPVRVEAGYKWAQAARKLGDLEGSESILWLLHDRFVLDEDLVQPVTSEDAGRYWIARILLDLGKWQEQGDRTASAIRIYELLVNMNLPGRSLAEAKLAELR